MGLVAQALHEIQRGIARRQAEWLAALHEKGLAASVAIDALGDGDQRHALDAQLVEDLPRRLILPAPAVDHHEIRPGGEGLRVDRRRALGLLHPLLLFQQAREAAAQHLAHHAEIVARRDVLGFDVEGAVVALHEALGPRDDHAAHRIGPHDVGVVIDLHAADRARHGQRLAQRNEQLLLARRIRQLARQRLAAVLGGVIHQLLLLAALGRGDLDLVAHANAQGLGQHIAILDLVGEQHEARGGLIRIELRQKGVEHLARRQAAVGAGVIGTVAPVLEGAEKEHLNGELSGLIGDGEDVGFLGVARIDSLLALNGRERRDAVAQARGALEFQRLGGRAHVLRQPVAHGAALAGEKVPGLLHQQAVILFRDLAGAGSRATLDLPEQAGPRAVLVIAVRAGAQEEGPLQGVQRAVDRPDAGEGAEEVALAIARAAMLGELGRVVIAGEQDIGKALVVPQQHIEARLHLLDVVGFQQQRLGLRAGGDEEHGGRERDHPRDAVGMAHAPRIAGDAFADAAGLAHIEHLAVLAEHAIDARPLGGVAQMGADDGCPLLHGAGGGLLAGQVQFQGERFAHILVIASNLLIEAIRTGVEGGQVGQVRGFAHHAADLDEPPQDAMARGPVACPAPEPMLFQHA